MLITLNILKLVIENYDNNHHCLLLSNNLLHLTTYLYH